VLLLNLLVRWWQRRCAHDFCADIHEGGVLPVQVRWCRLCGAYYIDPGDSYPNSAVRFPDATFD
jgi:hypothetical protein